MALLEMYFVLFVLCVPMVTSHEDSEDWLARHSANHSHHDDHEYVMQVSAELVDAMLRRRGLSGFEKTIVRSCGGGRRSIAYFSELARCLRDSKEELPAIVEHFVDIEPNITVRNLIITTTCCGVLPLATMCKEKLCLSLQECPDHPGTLEVMNLMHSLLIKHYCANDASELMEVLRTTSVTCARQILRMITECWGKAGLDYNDITSVLRRLSRREKLCQQLVGTQKCVLEFFKTSEPCQGPLVDMIRNKTALVLAEFSCAKYGEEGKHLRDL